MPALMYTSTPRIASALRSTFTKPIARGFTSHTSLKMPEKVNDLDASRDPSVAKQYDDKSSAETKFQDFYKIADDRKICMMVTYRNGIGVRSTMKTFPNIH